MPDLFKYIMEDKKNIIPKPEYISESIGKIKQKKTKPRIIDFDEDGIGYDANSLYLYSKEIERLASISLEAEVSPRMMVKEELERLGEIYIEEARPLKSDKQLIQKEMELLYGEEYLQRAKKDELCAIEKSKEISIKKRAINRSAQKKAAKEKKINKLLNPVICFLQSEIRKFKEQEFSPNNVKLFYSKLPSFEGMKNDLVDNFLNYIHYDNFKKLINFSEETLISINEVVDILKKIDTFSENLGLSQHYSDAINKSHIEIRKIFCEETIVDFFENSIKLFIEHTLYANNYNNISLKIEKREKIKFSNISFLDEFILKNNLWSILNNKKKEIRIYFNKNYSDILVDKQLGITKNNNLLKVLFLIIKKYLINFFYGNYFFKNEIRKKEFVVKLDLNLQESPTFELVKNAVFKLKWWDFILKGINPIFLFKKGFKERLSQKLFLNMMSEEFEYVMKDMELNDKNKQEEIEEVVDHEALIRCVDALYSILNRLQLSNIQIMRFSVCSDSDDSMGISKSRQEIIDRLNNNEEIKILLKKISDLDSNARLCTNNFSKLLNSSKKVIESLECQKKGKKLLSSLLFENKNSSFTELKASVDGNTIEFKSENSFPFDITAHTRCLVGVNRIVI